MGGKCRHELEDTIELRADAKVTKVFHKFHLLEFFEQLRGHSTQLAFEFAEGFLADSVTIRGHTIPITPHIIHEITGLPKIGEYLNKREQYSTLLNRFHPSTKQ